MIDEGRVFAFKDFSNKLADVQGVVRDVEIGPDCTPFAVVDVLDTQEGAEVVKEIRNKKPISLAWQVQIDEEGMSKEDGRGVRTISEFEFQSLTFTDNHSFDVPPVSVEGEKEEE